VIEIGRWAGIDIPILNLARGIWVTGPFPEIPSSSPFVEDMTAEWYYRPEGAGVLMGMGKKPGDELEVKMTYEMMEKIIEAGIHRVPVLEKASVLTSWVGVRPMTPDDRPILGPVPYLDGFILNCGWGGTGIIQAPIAGQLVAEYINDGHTTTLDISPLGINRFEKRGHLEDKQSVISRSRPRPRHARTGLGAPRPKGRGSRGTCRSSGSLQSAVLTHDPHQSVEGKSISRLLSDAGQCRSRTQGV